MQDKPGFEAFYRHWRPQLYRFLAWYEQDTSFIDDVVQEVMISAYRYWETLRTYERPGSWLLRVARQRASLERKRRHGDALRDAIHEEKISARARGTTTDVDKDMERVDNRLAILPYVRKLPPQQIAPIVLHFWGYSDVEIAEITGLRPATVRTYRSNGLRTLNSLHPGVEGDAS